MRWWPVIGKWHEDKEIVNFPWWHFHIDWRFVDKDVRIKAENRRRQGAGAIAQVIVADAIVPEGETRWWGTDLEDRDGELLGAPGRWFRHEVRTHNGRPALLWPTDTKWLQTLERRFAHTRLGGNNGYICPHRGANLDGIEPDEHGEIECPLHGLRWCATTGEARPRARQETSRKGLDSKETVRAKAKEQRGPRR